MCNFHDCLMTLYTGSIGKVSSIISLIFKRFFKIYFYRHCLSNSALFQNHLREANTTTPRWEIYFRSRCRGHWTAGLVCGICCGGDRNNCLPKPEKELTLTNVSVLNSKAPLHVTDCEDLTTQHKKIARL